MSECNCGNSRCCTPKRGERGLQGKDGARGADGSVGPQGDVGPQGPAGQGVSGALVFNYFATGALDSAWPFVLTPLPGVNHTVAIDGDYQVHLTLLNRFIIVNPNVAKSLGLYINGNPVVVKNDLLSTIEKDGVFTREVTFLWRGTLVNGDVIDVRVMTSIGVDVTSVHYGLLVNRETA